MLNFTIQNEIMAKRYMDIKNKNELQTNQTYSKSQLFLLKVLEEHSTQYKHCYRS